MPGDAGLRRGADLRQSSQRLRRRGAKVPGDPGRPDCSSSPHGRSWRWASSPGHEPPPPSSFATPASSGATGAPQRWQAHLRQGVRNARHRDQIRTAAVRRGAVVPALQRPGHAQESVSE